ncbi:MAG: hypothetical protein A2499_11235 [Stygiobacter sp. RIFOXYC12_FULL_38_8]|nr:MAG: hypothetical protein A2299_12100 [Stygiobacter sp. RIFOXYB2_FULL_37_11]OGV16382.1 MAG: hypothetical protein A2440_05005 [Stygiobacter sp. RIFOXYC2_FULL_38_25]OGV29639.1 MAG: hypothetical protein A2499_11235 [Stygiobacter sp. RIFOXYC12_FULL_38_8]OGV81526.1 MAG: hypothetical protein A2X65_14830 [Stygiobacter sp. GWF2_38_21]
MKKTIFLLTILLVPVLFSQSKVNFQILNANNIRLGLQNIGNLNNRFGDGSGGGYWKMLNQDSTIVFDQGPWLIGKINNKVHLAISQWGTNYSPGPIINNKAAMQYKPEDSLKYRIYKISKGDNNTNKDYAEWPFEFGAPRTKDGKPKLYQDQTLWTVFNSYDPTTKYKKYWTDSLFVIPVEIQQLAYSKNGNSKDDIDLFSNTVFFEWTVINKGTMQIDSAYFSFWTDIDFSNALQNTPAVDSINSTGYLWTNATSLQPVVGYTLLFGPTAPSNGNKATVKGKIKNNFINLDALSFHAILDDSFIPGSINTPATSRNEAWNIVRGLYSNGKTKINPTNNKPTKLTFSGDPVTNSGWIFNNTIGSTGGGAGFNLSSGPFNLAPNDTQWVMMALVPAYSKDYKESITIMRNKVKLLKSLPYDSLAFGRKSVMVGVKEAKLIPTEIRLEQNYPNPFNPETAISYQLSAFSFVTLKVYDVLGREVATLVNEHKVSGVYEVKFNRSNLASGIYFYRLTTTTAAITKKMIFSK